MRSLRVLLLTVFMDFGGTFDWTDGYYCFKVKLPMLFGGNFYIYLLDLVYIFSSICIFEFSFEFSGLALLKLWLGWELTSISIISWLSDCLACWTIAIFFESNFFSLSPKNLVPWDFFKLQRNSNAYLLTGSDPSSVNFTIF